MRFRPHSSHCWPTMGLMVGWCMGAASSLAQDQPDPVELLLHSSIGQLLLEEAQSKWELQNLRQIREMIRWGEVSKTDAVLTRYYDPVTKREALKKDIIIYLRKNQTIGNSVLDLVHELTHAVSDPSWDPYDPELTAGKYILASIEGDGGEVDAVVNECQASRELYELYGQSIGIDLSRCGSYWAKENRPFGRSPASGRMLWRSVDVVSREMVRADFYRVGKWYDSLMKAVGSEKKLFPWLTRDIPSLISSTGMAPYPWALLEEFKHLTQAACRNSRERLYYLQEISSNDQTATTETPEPLASATRDFIKKRCFSRAQSLHDSTNQSK